MHSMLNTVLRGRRFGDSCHVWQALVQRSGFRQRTLSSFLNMSMKKIRPWSVTTSIESKTNPKLPKSARQRKKPRELEEPALHKRKLHHLVLQRSLAQRRHLQRLLLHHPGQPMDRRGLCCQRRHPAQGDLMLGKQAVNRGAGNRDHHGSRRECRVVEWCTLAVERQHMVTRPWWELCLPHFVFQGENGQQRN